MIMLLLSNNVKLYDKYSDKISKVINRSAFQYKIYKKLYDYLSCNMQICRKRF